MGNFPLKPAASIDDHISRLRSRGMEVDKELARQWLSNVSYYRLSGYWYPKREQTGPKDRGDKFIQETSFSDVIHLYEADRKLRTTIHDGIERVEVALRCRIGENIVNKGPTAYRDRNNFRDTFDHDSWIKTVEKRLSRAQNHNAVKHYKNNYGEFPFWVLADTLDFSDLSRLYHGLRTEQQRRIAEELGIVIDFKSLPEKVVKKVKKNHPFAQWLHQLTIVRNSCAHHARIWNASFIPASTKALQTIPGLQPLSNNEQSGQSERIYGSLIMIAFLLETISPNSSWRKRVEDLINTEFLPNPIVNPKSMGLPENWQPHTRSN